MGGVGGGGGGGGVRSGGGGGGGGGGVGWGQGGCELRSNVFGKIYKKKIRGGGGGGSVTEGVRWGGRVGGGGGGQGDVNAMFGVGGDVGYGGCEPRIEGIVQCTKRYCTILRK